MARQSRNYIKQGYYHLFLKAHVETPLFRSNKDFDKYLDILRMKVKQFNGNLIAYVLLTDNIQIIIEETASNTISSIMHGTSLLYTKYYQRKYDITGPIFSGRFKSEIIHHNRDLLCRVRFLHQRPTIGCKHSLNYEYSSFSHYLSPYSPSFLKRHIIYDLFNKQDYLKASNIFKSIHYAKEDINYFNQKEDLYARVETAKLILKEELTHYNMEYIHLQKSSSPRDHVILRLHQQSNLNKQEIADLLSLSRHVVGRIIRFYEPK